MPMGCSSKSGGVAERYLERLHSDNVRMCTQAVELRSRLQREVAAKEKEAKERELRELAMRARMDRAGGAAPAPAAARTAGTAAGSQPSSLPQSVFRMSSCQTRRSEARQGWLTRYKACEDSCHQYWR